MPFLPEISPLSRLRAHAARRKLDEPGVEAPERLARAKAFVAFENKLQLRMHRRGEGGPAVVRERAAMVDVLLESLWRAATGPLGGAQPGDAALLALGGYGRAELCPHSDLDILFLHSGRLDDARREALFTAFSSGVLYPLWDLGFKVGHAVRDIPATLEEARKNILTKISLLEIRLITGDRALFEDFRLALATEQRTPGFTRETVRHLLDEQDRRRNKHGGSVFVQEPDVKNGVGGLRDFQTLIWLSHLLHGAPTLRDLVRRGRITAGEAARLDECRGFLLRVRTELHHLSPRPNDTLPIVKQPLVAENLGYAETDWVERVEHFMRDYYAAADYLLRTVREAEWLLDRSVAGRAFTLAEPRAETEEFRTEAFVISNGRIDALRESVFDENPVRLIRVFRHAQQRGAALSGNLVRLIRRKAPLFTFRHAREPEAHKAFFAILGEAGRVEPALRVMRELGVLIRYIPEFAPMICLVQHELYHRYTADIHTLNCLGELDSVFTGDTPNTDIYREALFGLEDPSLLYLILLLHDIGKPLGIKGHAETGVGVAAPFLDRLGVTGDRRALVEAVIRKHLDMGAFWQRHDIDDPDVVARFADSMASPEMLRLLFTHTFCDARATTRGLWTSYKDSLHSSLYRAAIARLEGREAPDADPAPLRAALLIESDKTGYKADDFAREDFVAHLENSQLRYLRRATAPLARRHAALISRLMRAILEEPDTGSLVPALDWDDDDASGMAIVTLASWDRPGLFYRVCGAFTMSALSIHATQAFSREDGIALDVFHVTEADGAPPRPSRRGTFLRHLAEILGDGLDPREEILAAAARAQKPHDALIRPREPRAHVVYDAGLGRTVVEIRARDRLGLLFELGRILFSHRRDIAFARIATESGYARDTFYLEPFDCEPEPGEEDNIALARELLHAIT